MRRVDLVRIVIRDGFCQEQFIYLRERDGGREFPIVIGRFEAESISRFVNDRPPARPMTHDLLTAVVRDLGATVDRIAITHLESGTFFAELHLEEVDGESRAIDCRPSDAIALAVRTDAPIYVSEDVLRQVAPQGALPDLDI